MRRIDQSTVELTEVEQATLNRFNRNLDRGQTIPRAAINALAWMDLTERTPEFVEYLSDGTCRIWGQRVLIKPEWR
jgi:hypothetical protein